MSLCIAALNSIDWLSFFKIETKSMCISRVMMIYKLIIDDAATTCWKLEHLNFEIFSKGNLVFKYTEKEREQRILSDFLWWEGLIEKLVDKQCHFFIETVIGLLNIWRIKTRSRWIFGKKKRRQLIRCSVELWHETDFCSFLEERSCNTFNVKINKRCRSKSISRTEN